MSQLGLLRTAGALSVVGFLVILFGAERGVMSLEVFGGIVVVVGGFVSSSVVFRARRRIPNAASRDS